MIKVSGAPRLTTRTGSIRVVVADDHPVVRSAVASILEADPEIRVVGEAQNGEETITLVERAEPHVLVADLRMPDIDGIEVCTHLGTTRPKVEVVIFTQYHQEGVVLRAFEAGAKGFLVKVSDPDLVREAVREVAAGRTFLDPAIASKVVQLAAKGSRARGPFDLTRREMRVLELLPKGLTNRDIAGELGVSRETVKTHIRHILCKLQVTDRAEAAATAVREGLA